MEIYFGGHPDPHPVLISSGVLELVINTTIYNLIAPPCLFGIFFEFSPETSADDVSQIADNKIVLFMICIRFRAEI